MFGFFGKKKAASALNDAFKRMDAVLTDDDMQLRILGPDVYSEFKALSAIDRHPDGEGEFGRSFSNPVPVNGPIGSIAFMSCLGTPSGHRILFHRIKTIEGIDIYEFVSVASDMWGFIFLDMYHSRKSRNAPEGLVRLNPPQQFSGFNNFWDDFPMGYAEQKATLPADLATLFVPVDLIAKELRGREFHRPLVHELMFKSILAA